MEIKKHTSDPINSIMEHICEQSDLTSFDKTKECIDFHLYDTVICNYMSGLFKIVGINKSSLVIDRIDKCEPTTVVSPGFLEKIKVDPKVLKVLYG